MKNWIIAIFTFLAVWVSVGIFTNVSVRSSLGEPAVSQDTCIDIVFTGSEQKQQHEVFAFLRDHFPYEDRRVSIESSTSAIPLFRVGYVKLSFRETEIKLEEVSRLIEERFPALDVSITATKA